MSADLDVTVRPAVPQDIPAMAAVLGRAFRHDDPVGEFLFPDDRTKGRQVRMMSVLIKRRFIPQDCAEVALADGKVVGVCLWHGPRHRRTPWHTFASGLELLWAMRTRVTAGIGLDSKFAKVAPGVPHQFIVYLGCEPDLQKRGVGEALFRSFLGKADAESIPVIGVCKDGNIPYYEAFGGKVLGRTTLGRNITANVMLKLPNTPATELTDSTRAAS
ncbi:MAG: GNAT family N-acetyltransferase [Rhodococcus sp.]|nr:GNAT family N-acetyltransferase [Rhodococcus sp. (in: high G+C Gram-positive bacteria)]